MPHRPNRPRSAKALHTVILATALAAIAASILIPVSRVILERRSRAGCARNLNLIQSGIIVYSSDPILPFALPPQIRPGSPIRDAAMARAITAEIFAMLSRDQNLPHRVFTCPVPIGHAIEPVSYAYDWARPVDADPNRVVLADRGCANHRQQGVVVCHPDGHTAFLLKTPGKPLGLATIGDTGEPIDDVVANPLARGDDDGRKPALIDNIFDSHGDERHDPFGRRLDDPLGPEQGSLRRAWVK